jgi:hypothetical protein
MGSFFTNYQVRSDSALPVREALAGLAQGRAYVSPPKNGWVSVYDEKSDEQDDRLLRRIAAGLSGALKTAVLAFLVHDSDIAAYWFYHNGQLVDEFDSAPDYYKKASAATRARVRGNPDALLPLCIPGTTRAQIDAVLHHPEGPPIMAEEIITELAPLLGIDEMRICLGFTYFDEEGEELLPDIAEFEPVGRGAERKEARPAAEPEGATPASFDPFVMAVAMLTQSWGSEKLMDPALLAIMPGAPSVADMLKRIIAGLDRQAHKLLESSNLPNRPTFEELKTARDHGAEALADLLAQRTPARLPEIGINAAGAGAEQFVAALLRHGLDPNAPNPNGNGMTALQAAERHGTTSRIYQLLKTASDLRG